MKPTFAIDSGQRLSEALGNHFVILFGSAVSGVSSPNLPMVYQFRAELIKLIAGRLATGSKPERLVASYAHELTEGRYKSLLDTTKFETFLWKLKNTVGKDNTDDLLFKIFVCSGNQYGSNQSALAFLLKKRHCLACLTTNFDNTLNLCYPGLQVINQVYTGKRLPSDKEEPILIKLHGDAMTKTCIATSPELSEAKSRNQYSYIDGILSRQKLLILGYSGLGDIDVAPHLRKLEAQLYWSDYPKPRTLPGWSNQIPILCNLASEHDDNLLLAIARHRGWRDKAPGKLRLWQLEMRDWVSAVDTSKLSSFILSLYSWQSSWPNVHVAFYKGMEERSNSVTLELANALDQVAAYRSAKRTLMNLLQNQNLDDDIYVRAQGLLGFTYWRQGKHHRALETLGAIIGSYHNKSASNQEMLPNISLAAMHYLETIGEMVQYCRSSREKTKLCESTRAFDILTLLDGLPKRGVGIDYLSQLATMRIHQSTGKTISIEEVNELFEECFAMEEWAPASVAAQLLLSLSFPHGLPAIMKINGKLRERRSWKLIQKNLSYVAHERLGGRFPLILKVLNGSKFMNLKTLVIELNYKLKQRKWNHDWDTDTFSIE